MNIDDLKLPGVDTNVNQNPVPASPEVPATQGIPEMSDVLAAEQAVQQQVLQPAPVVEPTPAPAEVPVVPPVPIAPQQVVETPAPASTPAPIGIPAMPEETTVENQSVQPASTEIANNFTPVDQVVPKESETIVPPIPVPAPAQVVDTSNLPPSPAPIEVPINNQEVTVVNTTRRKSSSNLILVVLALLLVVFVMNIDTVINFVQTNILPHDPTSQGNTDNNNLVDGFIKVTDSNSDYTLNDIRFYNFRKSGDNNLLINYSSEKNHSNVADMNIYIEIYNSNKEIIAKQHFDVDSIANSVAGVPYRIAVNEQVYNYAFYAKVIIYSEEDLKRETKLTCTYSNSNENYLSQYKVVYNFINNELNGYDVNKKIEVLHENKATTNAISVLEKENNDVTRFEIPATFENNVLDYKVDLNNVNEGYIPLYGKGTTPAIVKINEELKENWICE